MQNEKCKMKNIYLSVVIPAYNEEGRIEESLSKILDYLDCQRYNFEVIVVDDGSIDKTESLVKNIFSQRENAILLKNKKR
jgi:dolichyl-phosphate beta-glucosyltransferase